MRPSSYHPDGEDMRYFEASGVSAFGQGPYRFADERGNKLDEGWRGRDSWYEKTRSGDHVVEYDSLSHCHSWMGEVRVALVPVVRRWRVSTGACRDSRCSFGARADVLGCNA